MSELRVCKKCSLEKELNDFISFVRKNQVKYAFTCLACEKIRKQQYYLDNREKLLSQQKNYQENNKETISVRAAQYYIDNRDTILAGQKAYNKAFPERKKAYNKKFNLETGYNKKYQENNRERINENKRINERARMANDISFKLKKRISRSIWGMLKKTGAKKSDSCVKHFQYTIEELKDHLETQFEFWMTWENYGRYDPKTWNDEDSSTWMWSLDHKVPHSDLPYKSMEDENFKKCWSLDNLRPLSAKQNNIDGSTRVRHSKVKK